MRVKRVFKIIALILAGVTALTAAGFGVKAIVDKTKEDLKTITPNFEVGSLGSDGKYVKDDGTLYTKEAFGCYGLQVKPDFDSSVNYQIFYYDILDNYISSTSSLSDGFSGEAPVNGAYARMVIEPKNDEDGKISLTERVSYPKQLTVKVKKEQDINNRFVNFKGKLMQVAFDTPSLIFEPDTKFNWETLEFESTQFYATTASTVLKVDGGSTLRYDFSSVNGSTHNAYARVFQFKDLPLEDNFIGYTSSDNGEVSPFVLDMKTKYIIIVVDQHDPAGEWSDTELAKLPSCFTITKTK